MFADKFLRMGLGFVVVVLISRHLGPDRFGVLSFGLSWLAMFSPLATLGLDSIVTREIVRNRGEGATIVRTALAARVCGGVVAAAVSVGAVALYRPGDRLVLAVVLALAMGTVFQAADVVEWYFQARMRFRAAAIGRGVSFLLSSGLRLGLIMAGADVRMFALANAVEAVLSAMALWLMFRRERLGRDSVDWRLGRTLLHDSWPLMLSSFMVMVYMRLNQVLLEALTDMHQVGIFAAASRIAEGWYFVPVSLVAAVFPKVIESRDHSPELFRARVQAVYDAVAAVSIAIALPLSLLSAPLIRFLYGDEYAEAARVLAVLSWSGVFAGLGVARSAFLTAMNWTRFHLFSVTVGSVVSLVLNPLLIPRWGGLGAAVATLLAYWGVVQLSCVFDRDLWPTARQLSVAIFLPRPWRYR